jgi:hypothetical protein
VDGLHEVAASGVVVSLGGKPYTLLPLRAKDWGEAARYLNKLRPAPIEIVKDRLNGLTEAQQNHLLELAYRDERDGDLLDMSTIKRWFETPEGGAYRLWMGLRRTYPEIDIEAAGELLKQTDEEEEEALARTAKANEGLPEGNSCGRS